MALGIGIGIGIGLTPSKGGGAQPLITSGTYTGTGVAHSVSLGFRADYIFVKADSQYGATISPLQWQAGEFGLGNLGLTGSSLPNVYIEDDGFSVNTDASLNSNGVTYHYLAVKDNGAGFFRNLAYMGYRDDTFASQGATSDPWTYDLLEGLAIDAVRIKRDAAFGGREGVWLLPGLVKKESANAAFPYATLNSDGTIDLTTDVSVNENDGQTLGEAHAGFALIGQGTHWDVIDYTGNGSARTISASKAIEAVFIIPNAAVAMTFAFRSMGANSADGGQTVLHTDRITGISGAGFSLGTSTAVNNTGTAYKAVVFYRRDTAEPQAIPSTSRSGILLDGNSGSRIDCGLDNSLTIGGPYSIEWIGAVAPGASEQVIMIRGGNASTGSRGTPVSGSFNYGFTLESSGLNFVTSDLFPSSNSAPGVLQRWRTGFRPVPGRFYHIIEIYDGSRHILAVDGVFVNVNPMLMSVMGANPITATDGLRMSFGGRMASGSWFAAAATKHAFGRLYDRALTEAECAQMFARNFRQATASDLSDIASSLIEEWTFTEGIGTTVAATKLSANNGALTQGGGGGSGWF